MRTILSDLSVQQYLEKLIESAKFSYGIIIGQVITFDRQFD